MLALNPGLSCLAGSTLLLAATSLLPGGLLAALRGLGSLSTLAVALLRRHRSVLPAQRLRGIGSPLFTPSRSFVPSESTRIFTRDGFPDLGSINITLDECTGAGISTIPLSSSGPRERLCFLTMFTPSTSTRPVLG